ncbi:UDP-N-acetylmuramate dehydrogenase [Sesbania bispinosa]|nr:UDP-N-acetylmuramate dehydrogenase [Sesbania bispinosa]
MAGSKQPASLFSNPTQSGKKIADKTKREPKVQEPVPICDSRVSHPLNWL